MAETLITDAYMVLYKCSDDGSPFHSAYVRSDAFVGVWDSMHRTGTTLWVERSKPYVEGAQKVIVEVTKLLKTLPEASMGKLDEFVAACSKCQNQLLELCDSGSDIKAAVEADAAAFGVTAVYMCGRINEPWSVGSENVFVS